MSAPAGMERTLAQLSELLDGELIGDGSTVIRGLNGTSIAQADELTFAEDPHRLADALAGPAGAILVPPDITDLQGRSGIRVASPRVAFARLLALYYPAAAVTPGIHATAVVGRNVRFGACSSGQFESPVLK